MVTWQNDTDKMVGLYGQNGIGESGADKIVAIFCLDFNSIEYVYISNH